MDNGKTAAQSPMVGPAAKDDQARVRRHKRPEWMDVKEVPPLRFTPWAYAKMMHLAAQTKSEISGYGISGVLDPKDPFLVSDFRVLKQTGTVVTTHLDNEAIAFHQMDMFEAGLQPWQFMRIWIHFHPGGASPSHQDEETFHRIFKGSDWGVMCIISRDPECKHYARVRFNVGPGGSIEIPVQVDWSVPFAASDHAGWDDDLKKNVVIKEYDEHFAPDVHAGLLEGEDEDIWGMRAERANH